MDCVYSGMSLARETGKMGLKALFFGTQNDILNFVEFLIVLETRCNYFTSLEGVILTH